MPNPNAIVSAVTRIDRPIVAFDGQRRARLDPRRAERVVRTFSCS